MPEDKKECWLVCVPSLAEVDLAQPSFNATNPFLHLLLFVANVCIESRCLEAIKNFMFEKLSRWFVQTPLLWQTQSHIPLVARHTLQITHPLHDSLPTAAVLSGNADL
jgi:mannose/fructose/N-acetylgalactosamine-specific phosphotransferase system component IIC